MTARAFSLAELCGGPANDRPYLLYCDARIDDRQKLAASLGLPADAAAADFILAAFGKWGADCPQHLIGDYAFVIADAGTGSLFCARDHIGARPFCYALSGGVFHVGAAPGPIVQSSPELGEIDPEFAAIKIARKQYFSLDRTFYKPIRKLAPGCTLTVTENGADLCRYWDPAAVTGEFGGSDEEAVAIAADLLNQAAADRLHGYRQPAVHLSGGLDSSAVAALAVKHQRANAGPDPRAYAWYQNSAGAVDDETRWIDAASRALALSINAPRQSVAGITELLRADWCDGPNASNLYHEDAVQRLAQTHGVDTILSGWGGDESLSFNGRGYQSELLGKRRFGELARISGGVGPISLLRGIKRAAGERSIPRKDSGKNRVTGENYLTAGAVQCLPAKQNQPLDFTNARSAMIGLMELGSLTARMEDWSISGRKRGIDYAYPLLDRRVMEFALSLPGHFFLRPGSRRWIMRQVLDPDLPALVRDNNSKTELARVEALKETLDAAIRHCGKLLDECEDFSGREGYVDIDRLREDIRSRRGETGYSSGWKTRALQFLKF
ncbi:asparagine synthase-related protein [Pontixanthobacter luteolus]|uniref:asparagine synthase-related protein n=1 Tax=Pontixanthobacter luteolus TaxID=295089 RepID=UPI00136B92EB